MPFCLERLCIRFLKWKWFFFFASNEVCLNLHGFCFNSVVVWLCSHDYEVQEVILFSGLLKKTQHVLNLTLCNFYKHLQIWRAQFSGECSENDIVVNCFLKLTYHKFTFSNMLCCHIVIIYCCFTNVHICLLTVLLIYLWATTMIVM